MFGLFKKKTEIEVLQKQYEKLMKESYELSKVNRTASDAKVAAAQVVLDKIDALRK